MVRTLRFRLFVPALALLLPLPISFAGAADWPQFRGPDRSGVSEEAGLPLAWSATKNILWKTPLPGPGSSSPIVFGKHVSVTCYTGYGVDPQAPGDMADLKRHLVCADRDTGRVLWSDAVQAGADSDPPWAAGKNIALHGYASHTPAADASGVYAYFGSAGAAAYSHSGEKKWHVRLGTKAGAACGTPVAHDEVVYAFADNSRAAFRVGAAAT